MPLMGESARRTILWIVVGLVALSFVGAAAVTVGLETVPENPGFKPGVAVPASARRQPLLRSS